MKLTLTSRRHDKLHGVITPTELLAFVRQQLHLPDEAKNVRFYVVVPQGGNWSNTQLEIGEETQVEFEAEWEFDISPRGAFTPETPAAQVFGPDNTAPRE